jgi:hypothetical protein
VTDNVVYANNARPERQADYFQGMALKKLNLFNFKYIRGLKEVSPDEISVIKGETPLKNAGRDEVRVLNSVADTISYK